MEKGRFLVNNDVYQEVTNQLYAIQFQDYGYEIDYEYEYGVDYGQSEKVYVNFDWKKEGF